MCLQFFSQTTVCSFNLYFIEIKKYYFVHIFRTSDLSFMLKTTHIYNQLHSNIGFLNRKLYCGQTLEKASYQIQHAKSQIQLNPITRNS